jgi:hypothetical protein
MSASTTVHLNTSSNESPLAFEHSADILHGLFGLGLDAAGHDVPRAGHVAERAGQIKHVAEAHRLAERQFGRGGGR